MVCTPACWMTGWWRTIKPLAGVARWAAAGELPGAVTRCPARFGMAAAPLAGLGQPEQSGGVGSLKGPPALSQVAQQVRDVCPEVGGLLKLRTPSSSALHLPSPGSPSE